MKTTGKTKIKIPKTEIARRCGFTPQYVGELLSGKKKNPESLKKVLSAINLYQAELGSFLNTEYSESTAKSLKNSKKKVA
jgi:transcriptional regulator with XRE-family HTH domain